MSVGLIPKYFDTLLQIFSKSPLDCIFNSQNGHKEVCLALVEYDKKLLESLLVLAEQSSIPEEKVCSSSFLYHCFLF